MKWIVAPAALLAAATSAFAQELAVKPLIDTRLRYEHAEQEGLADEDSDAVTLRVRAGVTASKGPWSVLAEAQGTLAVVDHYYDGLHGAAVRPLIADPENVALYRAQLQYKTGTLTLTAGRQRIALEDERFVGPAGFRQNSQTFDAVRVEWTGVANLRADVSYAWSTRTIWGVDGVGARQQGIGGDNVFADLSYKTSVGTLAGFAYLIDQDEAAVQGFRLSSQTYGARFAGSRALTFRVKLNYQLSYARQGDYHRNPNRYDADYYLIDAGLEVAPFKANVGYEVLGADTGVALTSFQTPAATLFKFNGWADKFVTTPPDGVRDLYGTLGWSAKKLGPLQNFTLTGTYHRFESDRLVRHYGNELDLLASGKIGRYTLSVRYAGYDADRFATDTRKLWLQVDWAI